MVFCIDLVNRKERVEPDEEEGPAEEGQTNLPRAEIQEINRTRAALILGACLTKTKESICSIELVEFVNPNTQQTE